jgi:hypothetical protein
MITKGKLLFLSAFLAAMAVTVGYYAATSTEVSAAGAKATASALPTEVNEFRGMTLQIHSPDEALIAPKLIDEIAATKVNTLALVLAGYQECCASTSIFIDIRRVPSDDQLRGLIRYARQKGLKVTLMPIVLLENPRDGEWRGKISPEGGRWEDWWERYTNFIMHYAHIAQDSKVDLFAVGSELISTEQQTDRWKALIKKVRGNYHGRLTYSANWDHYKVPQFWDDLDIIGMTTYYELTGGKKPTEDVLLTSWLKIKKDILAWQSKSKTPRPLLFTEVGWPNQKTAAEFPWDYYRAQDKPDPELQARCFKTFFQAWSKEPAVAGFLVWEWRTGLDQKTDPKNDTGYVPKDKPAMKVIDDFFSRPEAARTAPAVETHTELPGR